MFTVKYGVGYEKVVEKSRKTCILLLFPWVTKCKTEQVTNQFALLFLLCQMISDLFIDWFYDCFKSKNLLLICGMEKLTKSV